MRGIKWAIGLAALRRAAGVFNNKETSGVDQVWSTGANSYESSARAGAFRGEPLILLILLLGNNDHLFGPA